jgi:hypothetical protein
MWKPWACRARGFPRAAYQGFIDKVRDIVGLYLDPPQAAMVLAVDEKSQMQTLDRTAPVLPLMPAVPGRTTHDYIRHGTTSLFAALDITTGTVIGQHQRRHRHQEFLRFLKTIDAHTARGPRPAPDLRQLRHPQDPGDQNLAGRPSCATAPPTASKHSKPTSPPGSRRGTTTRNPSSGPKPPTRSWPTSPTT